MSDRLLAHLMRANARSRHAFTSSRRSLEMEMYGLGFSTLMSQLVLPFISRMPRALGPIKMGRPRFKCQVSGNGTNVVHFRILTIGPSHWYNSRLRKAMSCRNNKWSDTSRDSISRVSMPRMARLIEQSLRWLSISTNSLAPFLPLPLYTTSLIVSHFASLKSRSSAESCLSEMQAKQTTSRKMVSGCRNCSIEPITRGDASYLLPA